MHLASRKTSARKAPAAQGALPRRTRGTRDTRASKKEANRERIVAAALDLFQSKGFEATTTKEIARKAGIAEGTVFNYCRTKDDIALHFFEAEVEHAIERVRRQPRLQTAPLEEKLFALVQSQFEYVAPYEHFIGSSLVAALKPTSRLSFSNRAQALRHRYAAFVEELLEESLPRKRFVPLRLWAPDAFWLYYLGALLYWLHDDSPRKQKTLSFLDRTLKLGVAIVKRAV